MDIIFFSADIREKLQENTLKSFLNFLAFMKTPRPIQFSFVASTPDFMTKLSIKENILLDAVDLELSKDKTQGLEDYLNSYGNNSLLELFHELKDIDSSIDKLSDNHKKIASIVRGLVKQGQFLLLESPEKMLTDEQKELLFSALEYEAKSKKRVIIICSEDEKNFIPLCTKKIDFKKGKYILSTISEYHRTNEKDGVLIFKNFPDKIAS